MVSQTLKWNSYVHMIGIPDTYKFMTNNVLVEVDTSLFE